MEKRERIKSRNELVGDMLADGESLKKFYRFTAQNENITLHDACQIVINRPSASVCFSFAEWQSMGRRILKGKKGIPYLDKDGERHYVFDANDTHGEERYKRLFYPMRRLLMGLDELNGTSLYEDSNSSEYSKITAGIESYLRENNLFSEEEKRNKLLTEGITYSLYSKTGFPKSSRIRIGGLPYSLEENADFVKEIHYLTQEMAEEINDAYLRRIEEVRVVDDTNENTISDEPVILDVREETGEEQTLKPRVAKNSVVDVSEDISEEKIGVLNKDPQLSPMYLRYLSYKEQNKDAVVAYRLGDFYEVFGEDAVAVSHELDLTLTGRHVGYEEKIPMCGFPYHVAEKYFNVILENHDVFVIENAENQYFIKSSREVEEIHGEVEETQDEKLADEESEDFIDKEDWEAYMNGEYEVVEEIKAVPKPIQGRKKKETPLFSIFDMIGEEKTQSPQEFVIEWGFKRGSGFTHGKMRIYDKFAEKSTTKEFADFLKNEYGWGGASCTENAISYSPKGVSLRYWFEDKKENEVTVSLSWLQVAEGISDLIEADNYFDNNDWLEYEEYKSENKEEPKPFLQEINAKQAEIVGEEPAENRNTDLNELDLDGEYGGAKKKFRNNIVAIGIVKKLYAKNRNPTDQEKKQLAKYVGWGGIPQAFDERNVQWQSEYQELKNTLSLDEYEKAKGSVLNAHFTSKEVIQGIYRGLQRFGVGGNNKILEPAVGTGNFFGFMPKEIAENARLYGVELDSITGMIASKLYPQANVQIKGFEETTFENDTFDVVVGNVPFGGYGVHDPDYNRHNFLIHDYFIAKSIDKLKPNGFMAVVTSKGTMDKLNPQVRKYLADRAELVGAVRLPNNAFAKIAGTQVVADILFFQKRKEKINADYANWLGLGTTAEGFEVNNYFVENPQMVLGEMVQEHGLYGAIDVTVKSDGRDLSIALSEAIENLPQNIYENPQYIETSQQEENEVDYNVRPMCFKASNGKVFIRMGSRMVEHQIPKVPKDAYNRISDMINLRNQLRNILDIQASGCSDEVLAVAQQELNQRYDAFIRKYGFLNSQTNSKLFKEDGDSSLLFACENLSEDKKSASKADIFFERTIRPYSVPTSTDDVFEGLQISKNEKGCVDIAYIEELTKKDYNTVLSELGNAVFRNPLEVDETNKYSGFETAEEYLSGEVKKKLRIAKTTVEQGREEFHLNIQALEEVQPTPLTASEISVRLGASWVDTKYYQQFICETLGVSRYYHDGVEIFYNQFDGSYKLTKTEYVAKFTGMKAKEVYGTYRANAFRLFEDCLNQRATSIYDSVEEDGKRKSVLNQTETIAAREKQNKIKELFKDWIFANPIRREELENTYNNLFNRIRLPSYDGSHLKFPNMNPSITLKPHQKNAIHRITSSGADNGNVLLHHVVGSGKTYTMIASGMKLRQYGLAKKPMYVVPNHLVGQWGNDFRKLYPNAKILVATKDDLDKSNLKRFVSKVAMGDWDGIIIAQSSFAKINISPERQIKKVREEIHAIEETITSGWDEMDMPKGAIKNLERIKKGREAMLKRLLDETKKDSTLIFENLGVDYLFVDEAHAYKNKFLYTKMNNVAGISNAASQRASDLEMKVEYINELHGGDKGVVFATGTPISNSMAEMYTMQSYLQKNTLKELGINFFDSWAGDFGETITSLEMSPSGQGYKAKTRFAKFTNLPELLTLYRSFSDVQTADMVDLDVPHAERVTVALKPSETVMGLAEEIADRAEQIYGGGVDPHVDNMLKVTSDGKKLALDPRCIHPTLPDEVGSKLNVSAEKIFEIWEESQENRGTQIVFCDLSTPKRAFEDYEYGEHFDAYNDLKYKLVTLGIPQEEVAFIHDANSDMQKQALFAKMNSGKVRVLIGSTEKCGAGTNVQNKLVALHHLDTPYRPSDMEQREGRIIRQGNENANVKIFTYVTERTFDSYSYQILETKQRFIAQINKGDLTVREAEDIDETTLSYAEIKAITAANPKIKRKMELDSEASRLRVLEGQYKKNLYSLEDKIRKTFPEKIQRQTLYIERLKQDIEMVKSTFNQENFSINVNGVIYTDKKEGGRALTDSLYASKPDSIVAEYCGFKISLDPMTMLVGERTITLKGAGQYVIYIGSSGVGNMQRLDNFLQDFKSREPRAIQTLEQLQADLVVANEQVKVPFEHKERLEQINAELTEINAELDLNKREEVVISDSEENEDMEESNYMAVPNKWSEANSPPKKRERITAEMADAFYEQEDKFPNSIVFVKNGGYYETMGSDISKLAVELGIDYGADTIRHGYHDRYVPYISIEASYLSNFVEKLVNNDRQVKIIEELNFAKAEDSLLDFDIDKEIENMSTEEYIETFDVDLSFDYKSAVYESVSQEFEDFKNEELTKPAEEMFKNNYKIRFFDEIHDFFNNQEDDLISSEYFEALYEDKDRIISRMYDYFINNEYASINNYGDTRETIENYCLYCHNELLDEIENREEKEEKNMEQGRTTWYSAEIPKEAMRGMYDESSLFVMPNDGEYKGQSYYLPNTFIKEDTKTDGDFYIVSLPETLKVRVRTQDKKTQTELSASEYISLVENTNAEQYTYQRQNGDTSENKVASTEKSTSDSSDWKNFTMCEEAFISEYDSTSLYKMPNGKYEGYCFYLPNGMVKDNDRDDNFRVSMPKAFEVTLKNNKEEKKVVLNRDDFMKEVKGKTNSDYSSKYTKPSEMDGAKPRQSTTLAKPSKPMSGNSGGGKR